MPRADRTRMTSRSFLRTSNRRRSRCCDRFNSLSRTLYKLLLRTLQACSRAHSPPRLRLLLLVAAALVLVEDVHLQTRDCFEIFDNFLNIGKYRILLQQLLQDQRSPPNPPNSETLLLTQTTSNWNSPPPHQTKTTQLMGKKVNISNSFLETSEEPSISPPLSRLEINMNFLTCNIMAGSGTFWAPTPGRPYGSDYNFSSWLPGSNGVRHSGHFPPALPDSQPKWTQHSYSSPLRLRGGAPDPDSHSNSSSLSSEVSNLDLLAHNLEQLLQEDDPDSEALDLRNSRATSQSPTGINVPLFGPPERLIPSPVRPPTPHRPQFGLPRRVVLFPPVLHVPDLLEQAMRTNLPELLLQPPAVFEQAAPAPSNSPPALRDLPVPAPQEAPLDIVAQAILEADLPQGLSPATSTVSSHDELLRQAALRILHYLDQQEVPDQQQPQQQDNPDQAQPAEEAPHDNEETDSLESIVIPGCCPDQPQVWRPPSKPRKPQVVWELFSSLFGEQHTQVFSALKIFSSKRHSHCFRPSPPA